MQRPKRKQSIIPVSLLHPGSWRGKRSRSSQSGSPTDSGASIPAEDSSQSAAQSRNPSLDESPGPQVLVLPSMTRHSPTAARGSVSNREGDETPWKGLERALAALRITTKICPPLHSAVDGLKSSLHIFEEVAKSRKDYEELATGLTAMLDLLAKHMPATVSKGIAEPIASIARKITKELESINQCQSRGGNRLLVAFREEEDLIRRYRRIEQLFHQLQAEASMSTLSDTKRHLVNTQLENLGPVKLATYNSRISMDVGRRSCTENTRTKILSDSMEWADDPDGAKIYWMNGMAGTGKTTIGYSLCERLEAAGQLAGSFFCTRASRECTEAKQIVPTIAYQLARRSAPFRDALCGILDNDPDAGTLNTPSQFNSLLVKPLMESREFMARNLVVVIDALDECSDPHTVKVMLEVLFRYAANLPVKFFVTSRPEPVIRNSMMAGITECNRSRSILYLHEIEKSLVQADIELYLKDELKYLLPVHCADIEELAEQAGNLFIYAATAVRYICPTGMTANSKQRLKTILAVHSKSNKGMFDIDLLYSAILSAALYDIRLEPDERRNIEIVLWTSICASEPVLIGTLAALSGFDETELAVSALQPLRSVLHVSEHNNYVTTLHASFPDFISLLGAAWR
ncbi:hypothetical protein RSOLAG22IIIB_08427 [Rhizoctonia solani]|uniref:Nephrocystin 3-like N-terminal domain-containing protein n=1 Tax=Rhizoctonia solani TaxID=456999 RepID=A0A0K6FSX5_9AGAM|nr:hypothetical protein RSOLAG22IIIB_08427 [Rhizoctonia solani]